MIFGRKKSFSFYQQISNNKRSKDEMSHQKVDVRVRIETRLLVLNVFKSTRREQREQIAVFSSFFPNEKIVKKLFFGSIFMQLESKARNIDRHMIF